MYPRPSVNYIVIIFFICIQNASNRSLLYRAREHFEIIGKRTFSYFLGKDKFGLIDSIAERRLRLSASRVLASLVLPRYYKQYEQNIGSEKIRTLRKSSWVFQPKLTNFAFCVYRGTPKLMQKYRTQCLAE